MHVSTKALLKKEIATNKDQGSTIAEAIDAGEPVPDHIVNQVIENRLQQTDCKLNGWVLEGFPCSKPQINLLRSLRVKPSIVFQMEISEEESINRLQSKRFDPTTGHMYSLNTCPAPADIHDRLICQKRDDKEIVRKKWKEYRDFEPAIDESYKKDVKILQATGSIEQLTEKMCDLIENTMRA